MAVSDPIPLKFAPGIVRDMTRRSAELLWWDADKVRFIDGLPQSIGGWAQSFETEYLGTCRALFGWTDLDGIRLMGLGTEIKYYVEEGGSLTDITPVRRTVTLGLNPITCTNGSSTIDIADTSHGAQIGDYVTISGTASLGGGSGILNTEMDGEREIIGVPDANTIQVVVNGSAAAASVTGGGAAVQLEYQINIGLDTTSVGGGWGASGWSEGGWGEAASTVIPGAQLRVWTQDNWGEDLLINPRGYAVYYYDTSSPARATNITALPGASDVPVIADQIIVSADYRQALAFGTNEIGDTTADPMFYRWCATENLADWTPTATNDAGGKRLTLGSVFMCAHKMRDQFAVFTDRALYSVYLAGASGFTHKLISQNTAIIGPKAAVVYNDILYWQSKRGFYLFNGRVQEIVCPIADYVYKNMNVSQGWKCYAGVNVLFNEIWFRWPSNDSEEVDLYAIYKIDDGTWSIGTEEDAAGHPRTAWLESGTFEYPRAASTDNKIYDHEYGFNDGSTNPESPLEPWVQSTIFAINNGKQQMRLKTLWPDIDFTQSTAASPVVTITLGLQNRMGSAAVDEELDPVTRTVALPVEQFTDKIDVGKRGRFMSVKVSSSALDTGWRAGVHHLEIIPDGGR